MPDIKYGGMYTDPGAAVVTSVGVQAGPPFGDGWVTAARLPQGQLPSSAALHMVLMVKGRIGPIFTTGTTPVLGLVQVALGTLTGTISTHHIESLSIREERNTVTGALEGFAFFFMVAMSSLHSVTDPTWGASFDTSTNNEFLLLARTYFNGDPPTYSVQFEVADVQWLWFDLDSIPTSNQLCDDYLPTNGTLLTTSTTNLHLAANSPGLVGQKWLHFHRIRYQPRSFNATAPWFQFGYSPTPASFTGFTPKVGTNERWGQNRSAQFQTGQRHVMMSQGCFWEMTRPAGVFLPGVRCADRFNGAPGGTQTIVLQSTYFGVRLDALLDLTVRTEENVDNLAVNFNNPTYPWVTTAYLPMERSAPGLTVNPIGFVHGIVQHVGGEGFNTTQGTNEWGLAYFGTAFWYADANRLEGVSCMSWHPTPFSPTAPDVQFRGQWVGGFNQVNALRSVRDITMVSVYLIQDPTNLPNSPGAEPSPVVLSFAREGPAVGDVPVCAPVPDTYQEEAWEPGEAARIDGATGYTRTWPMFGTPRRLFRLQWTVADTAAIEAFLTTNNVFGIRPQSDRGYDVTVVVTQVEPFEVAWVDRGVYQVSCRVVELVWLDETIPS